MIQLFFTVIFCEMAVILLLLFKTPLRKLEIMTLDRVKRGSGPLVVKSVGATVLVMMTYSVYTIRELNSRPVESFNPTDQVLLAYEVLDTSLMGFSLFLALMIDRLHHYIRELRILRKTMEAAKKQSREVDEGKKANGAELNALKEEVSAMKTKINILESECKAKEKELKAAESNSESLKKQSEGLLLEYDRLLEDNQSLRSQLHSLDQSLANSDGKKNM
ncbi:uncharacterized protein [Coffea arabica]|uniref:Endoplasmic reticulum transmembrane protein n=1 Tax=Coffea arabica TaxID=13443 RepID=A0A6P6S765_COFAR|nr:B-cell receptor-associated protein 31-like [Coffea arabica]